MNQRIRELHSQCKVCDKDTVLYFDYEKFAELIVAEMLQTCEDHPAWTGRMIGEQIKQHFGVEL
jgi:hypothetical protein